MSRVWVRVYLWPQDAVIAGLACSDSHRVTAFPPKGGDSGPIFVSSGGLQLCVLTVTVVISITESEKKDAWVTNLQD